MARFGPLLLIAVAIIVRIIIAKPVIDPDDNGPLVEGSILNVPNLVGRCPNRCHRRDMTGRCRMNWTCYMAG